MTETKFKTYEVRRILESGGWMLVPRIAGAVDDIRKKRPDLSILAIGTELAKMPDNSPQQTVCIIGAIVEMLEPSQ